MERQGSSASHGAASGPRSDFAPAVPVEDGVIAPELVTLVETPEVVAVLVDSAAASPYAPPLVTPPLPSHPVVRIWNAFWSAYEWMFGLASLVVGLAVLGSIPLLQFLSLGYLMEVSGRIARSGRLRDGFWGVREAARLGSMALGAAILFAPLRLLADSWHSAQLIEPGSAPARFLGGSLFLVTTLAVGHVAWACFRGGRLRHFFWPAPIAFLRRAWQGGMYVEARDRVWNFFTGLRLWYFFRLGLLGFLGAVAWLIVPVLILVGASRINNPVAILIGLFGGMLLGWVLLYLPFLQTHFACEGRFRALFELGHVRLLFKYAPLAYWLALVASLLLTFPLFLTQVTPIPRELLWLPNLVCVLFLFPARLLTGWTMGRARKTMFPRFFLLRWIARLGALPVVTVYVFVIYFTQYVCYTGWANLVLQNTLLMPIPFAGG